MSRFQVWVVVGRFRKSPNSANVTGISKTQYIFSKNRRNKLGSPWISSNLTKYGRDLVEISLDLLKSRQKSVWISSNLVGFHQVWSRSHRNKLGSPRISPNLLESELDLAGVVRFVYYIGRVGWLGFWRRKPTTRPAGIGSWAQKPVTDQRERRFGLKPSRFVRPTGLDSPSYHVIITFLL